MICRFGAVAVVLLGCSAAHAEAIRAATLMPGIARTIVAPQKACQDAIGAAEAAHGIPTGFLLAISRVESGRPEPRTGLVQPWPWTIDVAGKGTFFESRSEAVAAVQAAQQAGVQSIDVGCLQVNLQQHPDAFATLDRAFDPVTNADYAGRFLVALWRESGDWATAAGLYHSRTEALAQPYREAVVLRFAKPNVVGLVAPVVAPSPAHTLAVAWAATLDPDNAQPQAFWPKPALRAKAAGLHPASGLRLTSRK